MRSKCSDCGAELIHVRDDYTGATFPVDADPETLDGLVLSEPRAGERNPRAVRERLEAHTPHVQTCPGPDDTEAATE